MQQMNVEKVTSTMDKFEELFGELDVRGAYMQNAMAGATATLTPEDDVDNLINQVADQHGLEIANDLADAGAVPQGAPTVEVQESQEEQMEQRLAKLRAELA